ncbi:thioesterase family protein [Haliangium ochraceum]|uniref:Thioesterase superfamily protein n=1 Tax=Haliangium ochraceum (strain DSM 14365 / JCM 11303 / SMP-2) TaxID=502025 RepID=D0LJG9_HALO1|nr:thioesterase family protein [Haliangium ochraceum]ACY16543.1 thioesterase superfamily protein [Haliangium ochraceum DSM 14365]
MRGEIDITVYYEDADPMGVVYYANYLKFFERGRSELLAAAVGKSIADINAGGALIAVYKAEVVYRAPARLSDRCRVISEILPKGSKYRMHIAQRLERDGAVLTEGKIELVCLDSEFKLRAFPPEIMAARPLA